jgi:hypothetical protein
MTLLHQCHMRDALMTSLPRHRHIMCRLEHAASLRGDGVLPLEGPIHDHDGDDGDDGDDDDDGGGGGGGDEDEDNDDDDNDITCVRLSGSNMRHLYAVMEYCRWKDLSKKIERYMTR